MATSGWYSEWFANGWFPDVWFAPADESEVPPEELAPSFSGGGRVVHFPKVRTALEYDRFKLRLELDQLNEAEDEEILLVLTQLIGEIA